LHATRRHWLQDDCPVRFNAHAPRRACARAVRVHGAQSVFEVALGEASGAAGHFFRAFFLESHAAAAVLVDDSDVGLFIVLGAELVDGDGRRGLFSPAQANTEATAVPVDEFHAGFFSSRMSRLSNDPIAREPASSQ
jgi:hypothetical protein